MDYLDILEIFLRGCGPVANTASTVSAYPNDGTFVTLETSCDVLTCGHETTFSKIFWITDICGFIDEII